MTMQMQSTEQSSKKRRAIEPRVAPLTYSITQAAQALGLSERSIYNLINAGKLRRSKIGRRSMVPAGDVIALANGEAA